MICYEVNLEIESALYEMFRKWLSLHVQEVLNIEGFKKVFIYEEKFISNSCKTTVRYELERMSDLQSYFDHHATTMRNKTEEIFGNQIKVSRRVLELAEFYLKGDA